MILIADSSALIALAIIDKLEILQKLFSNIFVPRAVYDEITKDNKTEAKKLTKFCKDKVLDIETKINFNISLGKGESEAVILYQEQNADFLLCDDKKAKKFAQSFGINVIGSLGVLIKAKKARYIEAIEPLIKKLKESQIYIDENTCNTVLKIEGEL